VFPSTSPKHDNPGAQTVRPVSDTLFGLCDTGNGIPALDTVSAFVLSRGRDSGFLVERDDSFITRAPLSVYAEAARKAGRIVEVS